MEEGRHEVSKRRLQQQKLSETEIDDLAEMFVAMAEAVHGEEVSDKVHDGAKKRIVSALKLVTK